MEFEIFANFELSGAGGAGGAVSAFLDGEGLFAFDTTSGQTSFNFVRTVILPIFNAGNGTTIHSLTKHLQCSAIAQLPLVPFGSCKGHADPMLSFDQAAFDELMGPATFRLEDYYMVNPWRSRQNSAAGASLLS